MNNKTNILLFNRNEKIGVTQAIRSNISDEVFILMFDRVLDRIVYTDNLEKIKDTREFFKLY